MLAILFLGAQLTHTQLLPKSSHLLQGACVVGISVLVADLV
jgi:hypothetical protein